MYDFKDTTSISAEESVFIPAEAMTVNGRYLEELVSGYRTLYTKGRESLGVELDTYSVGTADGETYKSRRYPARTITIGFQLIAESNSDFRDRFNQLNNILSLESADFVFHDEEDRFYTGTPIFNASVEEGNNSVKGEWEIYCAYPFKRSIDPITLTMDDAEVTDNSATWTIDYGGAYPAYPVLRATFAGAEEGGEYTEDGDCGFVAFVDGNENIIQLGNPDVIDRDDLSRASTLINKTFSTTNGFVSTGGHTWGNRAVTGSFSTSRINDAYWNKGKGYAEMYANPSYGSGTGWHGAILRRTLAESADFDISLVHRLCVSQASQTGTFECGARSADGVMVAGFVIDKTSNGTKATVNYIVNNTIVGRDSIDVSYYNKNFGYCQRTPVYVQEPYKKIVYVKTNKKNGSSSGNAGGGNLFSNMISQVEKTYTRKVRKGWSYTQSNLNSSISKKGGAFSFRIGNLPKRTFKVPSAEFITSTEVSMYMGTKGTAMHTNAVHSIMFRKTANTVFAKQPNVFTSGDIVEADCNDASVFVYRNGTIGGQSEPQYGALGNDWETFALVAGTNYIRATWSDWVDPAYKPQFEIEYNEVYI